MDNLEEILKGKNPRELFLKDAQAPYPGAMAHRAADWLQKNFAVENTVEFANRYGDEMKKVLSDNNCGFFEGFYIDYEKDIIMIVGDQGIVYCHPDKGSLSPYRSHLLFNIVTAAKPKVSDKKEDA